jgi:hypothetical protein
MPLFSFRIKRKYIMVAMVEKIKISFKKVITELKININRKTKIVIQLNNWTGRDDSISQANSMVIYAM